MGHLVELRNRTSLWDRIDMCVGDGDQTPGEVREELLETGEEGTGVDIGFLCSSGL